MAYKTPALMAGDYETRALAAGFDEIKQTRTRNGSRRDGDRF
jgi:hypothetical protein